MGRRSERCAGRGRDSRHAGAGSSHTGSAQLVSAPTRPPAGRPVPAASQQRAHPQPTVVQQLQAAVQDGGGGGRQLRGRRVAEHPHRKLHAALAQARRGGRAVQAHCHRLRGAQGRPGVCKVGPIAWVRSESLAASLSRIRAAHAPAQPAAACAAQSGSAARPHRERVREAVGGGGALAEEGQQARAQRHARRRAALLGGRVPVRAGTLGASGTLPITSAAHLPPTSRIPLRGTAAGHGNGLAHPRPAASRSPAGRKHTSPPGPPSWRRPGCRGTAQTGARRRLGLLGPLHTRRR